MKKNILRIILIILIIMWMITVFRFSNANGTSSSGLSHRIASFFSDDEKVIEILEPIIRKIAHLSEYAYGGFLICGFISTYKMNDYLKILCSSGFGCIYAVSDEVHQLFIDGRTGKVTDVIIDTIGICIGVIAMLIIIEVVKKIMKR